MEYKNDKCEFTAFVKAGLDSKEQENIEICIERVTKTVKEDFLNARARLYKDEVKNDAEVMTAFRFTKDDRFVLRSRWVVVRIYTGRICYYLGK